MPAEEIFNRRPLSFTIVKPINSERRFISFNTRDDWLKTGIISGSAAKVLNRLFIAVTTVPAFNPCPVASPTTAVSVPLSD
ncbi:MAG: hypothetical protein JMDDDDMK_01142 [Acidobacteria bacterium]|nr:hypothetical protein [Acidobacteriota bacterium]